jgi:hypothetical protein
MVAPNRAVAVPVQGITRIMKILFHSLSVRSLATLFRF